jgi:hypothetical protein
MVAVLLLAAAPQGAAESPYPVGTVSIELTGIGAGIGISWGSGILRFQGREHPFKVQGLSVGDVGIATVSAVGNVYNLRRVSDFSGTYMAAGAGISLAGGVGGVTMENQKRVVINLYTVQQGVQLNIGPKGFTISMR